MHVDLRFSHLQQLTLNPSLTDFTETLGKRRSSLYACISEPTIIILLSSRLWGLCFSLCFSSFACTLSTHHITLLLQSTTQKNQAIPTSVLYFQVLGAGVTAEVE